MVNCYAHIRVPAKNLLFGFAIFWVIDWLSGSVTGGIIQIFIFLLMLLLLREVGFLLVKKRCSCYSISALFTYLFTMVFIWLRYILVAQYKSMLDEYDEGDPEPVSLAGDIFKVRMAALSLCICVCGYVLAFQKDELSQQRLRAFRKTA